MRRADRTAEDLVTIEACRHRRGHCHDGAGMTARAVAQDLLQRLLVRGTARLAAGPYLPVRHDRCWRHRIAARAPP